MKIRIKKTEIPKVGLLLIFILLVFLNYTDIFPGKYLLVATIVLNIFFIFKFKSSQAIFICLCFSLTYWLYMLVYYFLGMNYCTYSKYRSITYTDGTLRVAGLFMAFLFTFMKPLNKPIKKYLPQKDNVIVYCGCIAIMLFIILYTFGAGGTFSYKEGSNSSLYEYYFIFAILAFSYTKKKWRHGILLAVNFIYVFALLRLGLRLVVLQIALMLFIEFFENKFKTKTIMIGVVCGFLFMSFWSLFRSGLVSGNIDILYLLGANGDSLVTNQGDVFYTSSAQYAQVYEGVWGIDFRLSTFGAFIANIFLLPSLQLPNGKLNEVLASTGAYVPGGGFGAMYAYVWLGIIGIILLAFYLSYFVNSIEKSKSEMKRIYGMFLIFTFFRWNAYNLAIVFKMGFYLFLIFEASRIFNRLGVRK